MERRLYYPDRQEQLLPTRLGNALRSLETYGLERYRLSSQTFWYELKAVAGPEIRQDLEDTRSTVDFYISVIIHLVLLGAASLWVAVGARSITAFGLGALSFVAGIPCYRQAVTNVLSWRRAVQALVNTGRPALADRMGYVLGGTEYEEQMFWYTLHRKVEGEVPTYAMTELLNEHRKKTSPD